MAYLLEWNIMALVMLFLDMHIKLKQSRNILEFEGDYTSPNEVSIVLPVGWSLLGYLSINPADCIAVFDAISSGELLKIT